MEYVFYKKYIYLTILLYYQNIVNTSLVLAIVVAPELFEGNDATAHSDIWSVGCTTIELLTGRPPYHEMGKMAAVYHIIEDPMPPFPEECSNVCL